MTHRILLLMMTFLISTGAHAKLEFDSSQLLMKNMEQMNELVTKKISTASRIQASQVKDSDDEPDMTEPEAIEALTGALKIILGRPDQDGARSGLFSRVRRELNDLNAYDQALVGLIDESIRELKKKTSPKVQATYLYILENLMAELKPDLKSNSSARKHVTKIRDANIQISPEARSQLLLRTMSEPTSPSETAARLLPEEKKSKKK